MENNHADWIGRFLIWLIRLGIGYVASIVLGAYLLCLFTVTMIIVVKSPFQEIFFKVFFGIPFLPHFSATGGLEIRKASEILPLLFFWVSIVGLAVQGIVFVFTKMRFLLSLKFQAALIIVLNIIALVRVVEDDKMFIWFIPLLVLIELVTYSFYFGLSKISHYLSRGISGVEIPNYF